MVFIVPAPSVTLTVGQQKTYQYISNWRACHITGGEVIDGTARYSEDLLLSTVLSYLAPIQVQCIVGSREGVPGTTHALEKTTEETNQTIMALVLASLMTLAKPVTAQNAPAFTKRRQVALASHNVADMVPAASWTNLVALAFNVSSLVEVI